jgi:hypothetical protein
VDPMMNSILLPGAESGAGAGPCVAKADSDDAAAATTTARAGEASQP